MNNSHPFFSKENIRVLYEIIQDYVYKNLVYRIGGEYVKELIRIMHYVYERLGKPQSRTPQTIQRLNRATLDEALPLFQKLIGTALEERQPPPQLPGVPRGGMRQLEPRPAETADTDLEMENYLDQLQTQQPPQLPSQPMSTSLDQLQPELDEIRNDELLPLGDQYDPYFDDRIEQQLPEDDNVLEHDNDDLSEEHREKHREKNREKHREDDDDKEMDVTNNEPSPETDHIIPIDASQMSTNIRDLAYGVSRNDDDDNDNVTLIDAIRDLPQDPPERETVKHTLLIDSRNRDRAQDPQSNMYRIKLADNGYCYEDIVSVELVTAEIPRSDYIVTQQNNLLHFQESQNDEDFCVAEIDEGNYTPESLRQALEQAMIGASRNDIIYRVELDNIKSKFLFRSPAVYPLEFNLLFEENDNDELEITRSIGKLLGFEPKNLYGENEYVAQNCYDFHSDKYLLIQCEELMNISNVLNPTAGKFLAKILLDVPHGETKYFMRSNLNRYICKFDPPLTQLKSLSFSFRTYDGELYDFRGCENSMTLEIIQNVRCQDRQEELFNYSYAAAGLIDDNNREDGQKTQETEEDKENEQFTDNETDNDEKTKETDEEPDEEKTNEEKTKEVIIPPVKTIVI